MRTTSRHSTNNSFLSRLFSTGSIFLNPESEEELLSESQESSHDPGDGGQYGLFGYVSPLGGFVGHAHSSGPGGFGVGFNGGPGHFGGGPGHFGGGPGGFGGPGPGPGGF